MFSFWFFIIPGIVGIVFLIMQYGEKKKLEKKYGHIDKLNESINSLEKQLEDTKDSLFDTINNINREIQEKKDECSRLQIEIVNLESDIVCMQYNFSDYDGLTSEECKNKLTLLKSREQESIRSFSAIKIYGAGTKKELKENAKQIIRCFNSECDNVFLNLSVKNIDTMRNKITKSFESLNKIFAVDGVQLEHIILEYKLEELNLIYTYELKKEQEKEQQRAIKEQMVEEEKVRREIERKKAKLEKDQTQ